MRLFRITLSLLLLLSSSNLYSQFHNYKVKYGLQGHMLIPSTEFDTELYRLSLLGRGFIRVEESSLFEAELGVAIGKLNGIDYSYSNWSTSLLISDLRLIFSPISSRVVNPYIYAGIGLLNWNVTELPKIISPNATKDNGWDMSIPIGAGFEFRIGKEVLFDFSGHYTFALTDDLNYFNNPTAKDGYFDIGFGVTFVMGSEESDDDNDDLPNLIEAEIGTDPKEFDTDVDGLGDGEEVNTWKTNPLLSDSDSDGIEDYDEVMNYKTDPNSSDSDGDDIVDLDEIEIYDSNPNLKDSDNDGLNDGYEVNLHKTNPTLADTDSDRLMDGEEVNFYKTNPLSYDSDNDGIGDGDEVLVYKTDPLDYNEQKIETPNSFNNNSSTNFIEPTTTPEILGITFDSGSSSIKPESETSLVKTLTELKSNPTLNIEIRGYTDNVGNENSNTKLSKARADAVRIWLVKKGIDALRIQAYGYGSKNPIADNNTEEGRIRNRRIEIVK